MLGFGNEQAACVFADLCLRLFGLFGVDALRRRGGLVVLDRIHHGGRRIVIFVFRIPDIAIVSEVHGLERSTLTRSRVARCPPLGRRSWANLV